MPEDNDDILEKTYEIDPESGAYVIAVNVEQYEEVFNDWDPTPLRRRDINPYLRNYLEESSEDIPLQNPLIIRLLVPARIKDADKEQRVLLGMRNYFVFEERLHCRARVRSRKRLVTLSLLAISLLTLMRLIPEEGSRLMVFYEILRDGMLIGGWVFGWEAIFNFSIQRGIELQEERKWSRFRKAVIQVVYV